VTDISQVIVIGLGALGTIYAAKLQRYNPDCVRVLVDRERLERYQTQGILLNGVRQDFHYILPDPGQDKADLILVATKADGLPGAIDAVQHFVHEETTLIALLNGISSEDRIAARYGADKVLHSFFVGHGSTRVGNAITFDGVGRIIFGEANAHGRTPHVETVCKFFDRAGIEYEVPDDILFAQWSKFVLNVGINQASAVLRATYGAFVTSPTTHAIAIELIQEAMAVARKVGIQNVDAMLPWCENFIRNMPPAFKSSMLQDIEAGNKTEVAIFGEAVCALGQQYAVPTPLNATFVKLIWALEEIAG
jgi:2-dehydropantoate 2-reductase